MSKSLLVVRQSSSPLIGLAVAYPSVGALERIGPDWDWIWIDAQHGDVDFRDAYDLVRVAELIQRPALVRVPSQDPGWVGKILDAGAAGVIVPMIESVAEAKAMIVAAKFPPLGNRSYGGRRVIDRSGRGYYKTANQDTRLILQLESEEAVGLASTLASIEGVDGLFLGPDDLMIRQGQDVDTPKNRDTIGRQSRAVADACRKFNKLIVGIGVSEAGMAMAKEDGYDLVVGGGDVGFLASGSKSAAQKLRNHFREQAPVPTGDGRRSSTPHVSTAVGSKTTPLY